MLLDVQNLSVDIPVSAGTLHAVRNVSFTLNKGETVCVVGESGCGKSLTSLALMGLLPRKAQVRAEQLRFDGLDLITMPERARSRLRGSRMSMIFQEPMTSLNPAFTVGDQLCEVYRRHKSPDRGEAEERAVYLLEKVGITAARSRLRQYPHELSGGLRQRIMIAIALMCGPDLLIADEPTTALDVTIQAQILRLLQDLRDEFGITILLITHDLGVVARIADRVIVMYGGQVVETGAAKNVFTQPSHPYTRGLLDCIPVPGAIRRGHRLGVIPGRVPSLIGDVSGCSFRNRCAMAQLACANGDIDMIAADDQHRYRCVLQPGWVSIEGGR